MASFLSFLMYVSGFLCIVYGFLTFEETNKINYTLLFFSIINFAIWCFAFYKRSSIFSLRESKFDDLIQKHGGCDKKYFGKGQGIAVNEREKILFLSLNDIVKKYTSNEIREWSKPEGSAYYLQIFAKDISNPEWKIWFKNFKDTAKWYEIVTQCVND